MMDDDMGLEVSVGKMIGIGLFVLVGVLGACWAIEGNSFFLYQVFAPKEAQVERKVFEETKSYNDGVAEEVEGMELAYAQADADHKAAIASIVLHRVAAYDLSKLPQDEQVFISELKRKELAP
jgi:hypothetical protein